MSSLEGSVKGTQEALKDLIKRPPLTDKLLTRPPFRYLHDILMELGRKHKFLRGLYSGSELDCDSFKKEEKEQKVAFLQKSMDALAIVRGHPMPCKASRMVSGQEAEKTNEFLQLIADTVRSKQDTTEAVQQVLAKAGSRDDAGGKDAASSSKSKDKDASDSKHRKERKHRSSKDAAPVAGGDAAEASAAPDASAAVAEAAAAVAGDDAKPKESKRSRRSKEEEAKKDDSKSSRSKDDKERSRHKESKPKEESEAPSKEAKEPKARDEERERHRDRKERDKAKEERKRRKAADGGAAEKVPKDGDSPATESKASKSDRPSSPKALKRTDSGTAPAAGSVAAAAASQAAVALQADPDPLPDVSTQKGVVDNEFLRPPLPPGQQSLGSGKQRGPGRPSSARPAPPRVRSRLGSAGSEEALSRVSSNVTVQPLVDDEDEDDNEDMFVVESTSHPSADDPQAPVIDRDGDPSEHGQLVRKILDTQKELDQTSGKPTAKDSAITAAQRQKRREKAEKEVAKLRDSVQTLCRSANPLAKTVDFIQEDVESMLKELEHWNQLSNENTAEINKEIDVTEKEMEPLRQTLADLDVSIDEKMELIGVLKANIAKNDQQINQLVNGIALSSHQ